MMIEQILQKGDNGIANSGRGHVDLNFVHLVVNGALVAEIDDHFGCAAADAH